MRRLFPPLGYSLLHRATFGRAVSGVARVSLVQRTEADQGRPGDRLPSTAASGVHLPCPCRSHRPARVCPVHAGNGRPLPFPLGSSTDARNALSPTDRMGRAAPDVLSGRPLSRGGDASGRGQRAFALVHGRLQAGRPIEGRSTVCGSTTQSRSRSMPITTSYWRRSAGWLPERCTARTARNRSSIGFATPGSTPIRSAGRVREGCFEG